MNAPGLAYRLLAAAVMAAALAGCAVESGRHRPWQIQTTDLRQFRPGVTRDTEVAARLGEPSRRVAYPWMDEVVWDYRYFDGNVRMFSSVVFNATGVYKHHTEELDAAFYSGGDR